MGLPEGRVTSISSLLGTSSADSDAMDLYIRDSDADESWCPFRAEYLGMDDHSSELTTSSSTETLRLTQRGPERMTSVLEMDSTYLLRREGAIIKLNMGRATRSGVGTMPLFRKLHPSSFGFPCWVSQLIRPRTFATRLFFCNPELLVEPVCAADTYESAAHRPNLVALTSAQAARIEFDHSAKNVAAKGVSFHFKGTSFTAKARKEVVLSTGELIMRCGGVFKANKRLSGTLLTPQPLELSGIGNSDVLKKHQITPKVDLPGVGEDYQDHILVSTTYEVKQGFVTYDNLGYNDTFRAATELWQDRAYAQVIVGGREEGEAYFASEGAVKGPRAVAEEEDGQRRNHSASRQVHDSALCQESLATAIRHHPLLPPAIDPNYLSKQVVKFADKIAKAEPLATMLVGRQDPSADIKSDEDITNWIKDNIHTLHHPIGTAATMHKSVGGAVDEKLKVYETSNLRVVDASVIPMHLATHMQRTMYGIAEKAAHIIISDWGF
ncbi:GMC oxidoreductase domain-containing protein [Rhizoctonia solani AG-1 IA]|uniref:GMC oxidoreductase domain-containing protein n=1 Tax=Thanatephorus cucumeris (strain AG1-IA) TaxID=983506 RepID=L8WEG9_THACA|nr:GMC oxidoreductase domain-containing protein [Rhizoctonia solani AG-1 IA]